MTNEEIITTIKDIKSATAYVDAVVDQVIAALGGEPMQEPAQEPQLKLEDVRAVLAQKSRAGHTAQVRELLAKYGADRLSAVDPADYPALLADAEALVNG